MVKNKDLISFVYFDGDRDSISNDHKKMLANIIRKYEDVEEDELFSPCPYCQFEIPETQLECVACRSDIPVCVLYCLIFSYDFKMNYYAMKD